MKAKLIKRIACCVLVCGLIVSCLFATSYAMQGKDTTVQSECDIVPLVANGLNFYPSFDDNHKLPDGVRFYKDAAGTQDITASATSMVNLANALGSTDGKLNTLYASLSRFNKLNCYTTVDTAWEDAFKKGDKQPDYGVSPSYTEDFKSKYLNEYVEGIHFNGSSDSDSWKGNLNLHLL